MKEQVIQHLRGNDLDEIQQSLQREARWNPYMRMIIPSCINYHFQEPQWERREVEMTYGDEIRSLKVKE